MVHYCDFVEHLLLSEKITAYGGSGIAAEAFKIFLDCKRNELQMKVCVVLWIFGIIGNIVNIIIFSNKRMKSPVNSLLLRFLAISDLAELLLIAVSAYDCFWCTKLPLFSTLAHLHVVMWKPSYIGAIFQLVCSFLLLFIHTITVGLNISLAIWRYFAVTDPFQNKIILDYSFGKLTILGTVFLSFALCLPMLLCIRIVHEPFPLDIGELLDYLNPSDSINAYYTTPYVYAADAKKGSLSFWIYIFSTFVSRIGLLILLTVITSMLIFAIVKASHSRQRVLVSSQTATEKKKHQNQMSTSNILVVTLVLTFFITEIPIALTGVTTVRLITMGSIIHPSEMSELLYPKTLDLASYELALCSFQQFSLVFNSSYATCCYLVMSSQYRKTLKLLLRDLSSWGRSFLKRDIQVPVQNDVELSKFSTTTSDLYS